MRTKLSGLVVALVLCGCAHRQMTKPSAIQAADKAFVADGHRLADYKRTKVVFSSSPTPGWEVIYEGLPPTDGGGFWVDVDDRTGATTITRCK